MIYAALPIQKKHLRDFLHFKHVDSLAEISVGTQPCGLPYWGPNLLSKCQYPLEVNSQSTVSLRICTKAEKREETSMQFVAGKGLKIVTGIISIPEVILLKNTIGRRSLPSEIFPGAGFQRVELHPYLHLARILYSSHDAVEQWCLLFLVLSVSFLQLWKKFIIWVAL